MSKITILGSGTFIPELKRNCSSYLLEVDNHKIMFDFGRGTIDQLLKLKINLQDLDNIFISHMHSDHSSELASFVSYILDNPKNKKLKSICKIYGPKGIKKDLIKLFNVFHLSNHKNLHKIQINELLDNQSIELNNTSIKSFKVNHAKNLNCIAFRIKIGNKIICYSGDSTYCEGLKKACRNTDLAIVESTLPKSPGMDSHLDGKELGKLADEENIHKLIITHVANSYLSKVLGDVKTYYSGLVSIAKDLMEVKI